MKRPNKGANQEMSFRRRKIGRLGEDWDIQDEAVVTECKRFDHEGLLPAWTDITASNTMQRKEL